MIESWMKDLYKKMLFYMPNKIKQVNYAPQLTQVTVGNMEIVMFQNKIGDTTINSFKKRGINIRGACWPNDTFLFNTANGLMERKMPSDWQRVEYYEGLFGDI